MVYISQYSLWIPPMRQSFLCRDFAWLGPPPYNRGTAKLSKQTLDTKSRQKTLGTKLLGSWLYIVFVSLCAFYVLDVSYVFIREITQRPSDSATDFVIWYNKGTKNGIHSTTLNLFHLIAFLWFFLHFLIWIVFCYLSVHILRERFPRQFNFGCNLPI